MAAPQRLIVGISGASGVIYVIRLLEILKGSGIETHLIMTRGAEITLAHETRRKLAEVYALADHAHAPGDIAASVSSGSFRTMVMIDAPCSMRSLAEIAGGVTAGLLSRAADVVLRERRRLDLMVCETPLHTGHLRNLTAVSEMRGSSPRQCRPSMRALKRWKT